MLRIPFHLIDSRLSPIFSKVSSGVSLSYRAVLHRQPSQAQNDLPFRAPDYAELIQLKGKDKFPFNTSIKYFNNFSLREPYFYNDYRSSLSLITSAINLFSGFDHLVFGYYLKIGENGGKTQYTGRLFLRALELSQAAVLEITLITIAHEIGHAVAYTSTYNELDPVKKPPPQYSFNFSGPADASFNSPSYPDTNSRAQAILYAAGNTQTQLLANELWRSTEEAEKTTPVFALATALAGLSLSYYTWMASRRLQKNGSIEIGLSEEQASAIHNDLYAFEETARFQGAAAIHLPFLLAGLFQLVDPQLYESGRCIGEFLIKGKRICSPAFLQMGKAAKVSLPKLDTYFIAQDRFYGIAAGVRSVLKVERPFSFSLEPSVHLFVGLPTGGKAVTTEKIFKEKEAEGASTWRYYGIRPELSLRNIRLIPRSELLQLSGRIGVYIPESIKQDPTGVTAEGCLKLKFNQAFSLMPCITYTNGHDPLNFLTISQPKLTGGVEFEVHPFAL